MVAKQDADSWEAALMMSLNQDFNSNSIRYAGQQANEDIEEEKKVLENIGLKLIKSEKTCDGVILVGKERVAVKVHRAIMAGNSLFFENAFFPANFDVKMNEEQSSLLLEEEKDPVVKPWQQHSTFVVEAKTEPRFEVVLANIELPEFEVFKHYCYTGELNLSSFEIGTKVLKIADDFQMPELKKELINTMQSLITSKNALKAFFNSEGNIMINEYAGMYLILNAKTILSEKNVLNELSIKQVASMLKLKLVIEEEAILEKVIEYATHNVPLNMGKKERRKMMSPIINLVNLRKLGVKGFQMAKDSKLFSKKELIDVLLSHRVIQKYLLPLQH